VNKTAGAYAFPVASAKGLWLAMQRLKLARGRSSYTYGPTGRLSIGSKPWLRTDDHVA
jgi:hypothetical protein